MRHAKMVARSRLTGIAVLVALFLVVSCLGWVFPSGALAQTVFMVSPQTTEVYVGDTFTLDIDLSNAPEFDALGTYFSFDTNTLEVTDLAQGPFPLGAAPIKSEYDNQTGQINYAAGIFSGTAQGSGTVLTITFKAKAPGSSVIRFDTTPPRNTEILNGTSYVPFTTQDGTVTIYPTLTADAGVDVSICAGASVQIGGLPTASGGTPDYSYSWSPTTGLSSSTVANPTATPAATTTYTVTVTDTNGRQDSDSMTVTVNPNPTADAGTDVSVCSGTCTALSGSATGGDGPYIYSWSPDIGLS
ncbi:MAG: cohesin domain-containing protein, partial [bacterium]|nr:cohesin domain-containing protein [bacterium]